MTGTQPNDDLIDDLRDEMIGIARDGMTHPATKPVLKGATIGAVAGLILPVVTLPLGLIAGAGYMLYKQVRP